MPILNNRKFDKIFSLKNGIVYADTAVNGEDKKIKVGLYKGFALCPLRNMQGSIVLKRHVDELYDLFNQRIINDMSNSYNDFRCEYKNKCLEGLEICCECGYSVELGSGCHGGRKKIVMDYDSRRLIYKYPSGGYICFDCDNLLEDDDEV